MPEEEGEALSLHPLEEGAEAALTEGVAVLLLGTEVQTCLRPKEESLKLSQTSLLASEVLLAQL